MSVPNEPVSIRLPPSGPPASRSGRLPRTTRITATVAALLALVLLADAWFISHPTRAMQDIGNDPVTAQQLAGIESYVLGHEYPRRNIHAVCPVAVQGTRHDKRSFTVYAVTHCFVPQPDCADASDESIGVVAQFHGARLMSAKIDDAIDYEGEQRAIKIFPSSIRDHVYELLDAGGPAVLRHTAYIQAGCAAKWSPTGTRNG